MEHHNGTRWASDAMEVTVIFVIFALVYSAVAVGALGTPVLAGARRLYHAGKGRRRAPAGADPAEREIM